jgi:hypothetical protein
MHFPQGTLARALKNRKIANYAAEKSNRLRQTIEIILLARKPYQQTTENIPRIRQKLLIVPLAWMMAFRRQSRLLTR